MEFDNRKSRLELQVIWKDSDMIELRVRATNGRFFGTTEVYDTTESLNDWVQLLAQFPNDKQPLVYEAGKKNGYAFWGMRINLPDPTGLVGVEITLEENINRKAWQDKVELEIQVYLAAIDNFREQLTKLILKEEGTASLYGESH